MSIPATVQDIEAGLSPESYAGTPPNKDLSINSSWSEILSELRDIEAEIHDLKNDKVNPEHDRKIKRDS